VLGSVEKGKYRNPVGVTEESPTECWTTDWEQIKVGKLGGKIKGETGAQAWEGGAFGAFVHYKGGALGGRRRGKSRNDLKEIKQGMERS